MSIPSTEVGPGFLAFIVFFFLAGALWLLMRNMFARLRRMNLAERAEQQRQQASTEAGSGSKPTRPADAEGSGVRDRPEEGERRGDEV
jgi:flagellar biosynthesis/type III secretory pathway M-ring protein FliF/YscJ